jgi:hypothetical protein
MPDDQQEYKPNVVEQASQARHLAGDYSDRESSSGYNPSPTDETKGLRLRGYGWIHFLFRKFYSKKWKLPWYIWMLLYAAPPIILFVIIYVITLVFLRS